MTPETDNITRLQYALGIIHGVDANGGIYMPPRDVMEEGLARCAKMRMLPPLSVNKWMKVLKHGIDLPAFPFHELGLALAATVVLEEERRELLTHHVQQRSPEIVEETGEREERSCLEHLLAQSKSLLSRRLHALVASCENKVGLECS